MGVCSKPIFALESHRRANANLVARPFPLFHTAAIVVTVQGKGIFPRKYGSH